ncbi:hypothetical protein SAMN04487949_1806 [Halogranum gelatinilyticum]|uniref:Uncharacterized protein n=1 Tax=Halogranum gelatinilyticum TaxID=660521 RepID=A0A1G9TJW4_9EURY|nr:hypothetical protein [Halogranum gelatinilyticum]SDM48056.1 hypothetical protein SAMN04487949_1806 [Halogranum gelatinilyticum]
MPSTPKDYVLTAIQVLLVTVGGGASVLLVYSLATLPPAPPGSDGFVTGGAYLWGGVALVLTLGITGVGIVLPAVFGGDDLFGFGEHQRLLLKAAAACFGGGFVVAAGVAVAVDFLVGVLVFFLAVLLGFLGVGSALCWRLGEIALIGLRKRNGNAS